jgi:hypothetical protein
MQVMKVAEIKKMLVEIMVHNERKYKVSYSWRKAYKDMLTRCIVTVEKRQALIYKAPFTEMIIMYRSGAVKNAVDFGVKEFDTDTVKTIKYALEQKGRNCGE